MTLDAGHDEDLAAKLRVNWFSLGVFAAIGIAASFAIEFALFGSVDLTGPFGILRGIALFLIGFIKALSYIADEFPVLFDLLTGLVRGVWWLISTPIKFVLRPLKGTST
ncbi:MAG: hypothetical protein ACRBCL_06320 [Maritimibacter sp.]